ncbi:hypothetical protein TI39_contig606g00007 [Zymoseptoria brevis]|uniref:Clr5 domain-containing protein n=1 Tax=Zymoseptoria brevis TaxID=1047168 RepID=A0A0F4GHD2_9PEZI|nr:hypothetical protein TI39_contig606g00007 [Zymoseptoria brevis]
MFEPPPADSAARQVGCKGDCERCDSQWRMNYSSNLADAGARTSIQQPRDETARVRIRVREKYKKYRLFTIQQWSKDKVSRVKWLRAAHSYLFESKEFPIAACEAKRPRGTASGMQHLHNTYLLPSFTSENLADEAEYFLALLENRISFSPEEWSAFDSEQHATAFKNGSLKAEYNRHGVIMHGRRYGNLVDWDASAAHSGRIMSFPCAKLVFDTQLELFRMLESVIDSIMSKKSPCDVVPDEKLRKVLAKLEVLVSTEGLRNSAFSPPTAYDLAAIIDSLRSRCEATQDALRQLQRDPDALRQCLEISQSPGGLSESSEDTLLYQINVISLAMSRANAWECLLIHAEPSFAELEKPVKIGDTGSRNYDAALATLERVLERLQQAQISHLTTGVEFSPEFSKTKRALSVLQQQGHGSADYAMYRSDKLMYHIVAIMRRRSGSEPIAWHIRELFKLPTEDLKRLDQRSRYPRCSTFLQVMGRKSDDPQHLATKPSKDSGAVSGTGFIQCEFARGFVERTLRWGFLSRHHVPSLRSILPLRASLEKYLNLPNSSGEVGEEASREAERSQRALDTVWSKLRERRTTHLQGKSSVEATAITESVKWLSVGFPEKQKFQVEASSQTLVRGPEAKQVDATAVPPPVIKDLHDFMGGLGLGGMLELEAPFETEEPQLGSVHPNTVPQSQQPARRDSAWPPEDSTGDDYKENTCPVVPNQYPLRAAGSNSSSNRLATIQPNRPTRTEVKKANLQIFESLLSPGKLSDLRWTEFLAAMCDAGCSVNELHGGSAVNFKHVAGLGSLVIHSPHPHKVLRPDQCREIKAKLQRKFGWTSESFKLKGKEEANDAARKLQHVHINAVQPREFAPRVQSPPRRPKPKEKTRGVAQPGLDNEQANDLDLALSEPPAIVEEIRVNGVPPNPQGGPPDISLYNSDELQYYVIQKLESGSEPVAWHLSELFKLPQDQLDRLDQRSIDMLSDIAAVDEMLTSLKSLRPRYSMMREVVQQASRAKSEASNRPRKDSGYVSDTEASRRYDIVHEFLETNIEWDFMFNHHLPGEEAVHMLQKPLEDYLNLPSCTDDVSVEAKRKALDHFWSKSREQRAAELQISQAEAIATAQLKLQQLSINTVQPDLKPVPKQKKPSKGKKGKKPRPVIPNGVPPVVQPNNAAAIVVQVLPKLPPAIEVKKSSLEFFEDLFGNSQDRSNLKWQGFTAAMGDAGWSVTPTYGSRVTFKNVRGAGSILIHGPHPGDLDARLAGRIATRLEWRLGWSKATFGEREKVQDFGTAGTRK